jgi:uncharacterized membrane protein
MDDCITAHVNLMLAVLAFTGTSFYVLENENFIFSLHIMKSACCFHGDMDLTFTFATSLSYRNKFVQIEKC